MRRGLGAGCFELESGHAPCENRGVKKSVIIVMCVLMGWPLAVWAQTRRGDGREGRSPQGNDLAVGEMAPDFELPLLSSITNKASAKDGGPQAVKLSSHRGKQPVVLILSSYT